MASIVVSGDTSGAITIAAPAVAGTNTLTLPASTGTLVVTGGAQTIEFAAGSAASPSITFTGDTNTGIFSPAADTIAFTEGGAEAMRINSSGNVLIGPTLSSSGYNVAQLMLGDTSADGRTGIIGVFGRRTTEDQISGEIDFYNNSTTSFAAIYALRGSSDTAAGKLAFLTGSSERMRITSAGDVGIGTASPNTYTNYKTLSIFGANGGELDLGDGANTRFSLFSQTTATQMYTVGAIPLILGTNSVERMRITSGGSVGINTTTPSTTLTVDVKSNGYENGIDITNSNNWGYGSSVNFRIPPSDGASVATVARIQQGYQAANKYHLNFSTYNSGLTERVRITADGFLKASNTGSYYNSVGTYHENRNSLTNNYITYFTHSASSSPYGIGVDFTGASPNNTTEYFISCGDTTNSKFIVYSNGTVQNRTGTYTTISDLKLKENVVDTSSKLEKLNQVRVVNYNLIGDELKQIGFVAQELEQVFPSIVFETPDLDEDKQPTGEVTKGVKLTVFIPILVKAIQEQQQIINDLKARIETLENK